ncbi:hemin uptake protein HemP [Granulosicoccus sp. 3-233]|uniref:hemin uptake protein HemP n=1 Tax=Granulosicoccus sp. 3-233 TaxID=3417969 RepID=UPI003D32E80D
MSDPVSNASSPTGEIEVEERTVIVKSGRIHAPELLGDLRLLLIEHNGEDYVLRVTKNNKLLLTK